MIQLNFLWLTIQHCLVYLMTQKHVCLCKTILTDNCTSFKRNVIHAFHVKKAMISLTKKNYSKLQFTIVYYTSKLWYYGTLIYYGKLWYDGQNYGTMDKTMVLY